jgi:prepilin-type N-terminal cleavage/methylation domain-containing protein
MKKGFTLLEMLVTIVVLTVGVVSVLRMMSIGIFADTNTENSTIAFYLAQEKMEEIKDASSYPNIDTFASTRAALSGDFSDFDRAVTVSGDPKQVNVIVYWSVKGQDQSVNLVSLFADYDY